MSKLDELIRELCPNGCVFKKVKDVANVLIGDFVHKSKQRDDARYPVYNGGITNTGFYDEYNRTANKIIICARGNAGFVNKVHTNFWSGNSCYTVDIIDENLDWKFAYYYLKNNEASLIEKQQKGGIPAVSKKQVEELELPVPPLEVQREIVRILDYFTELAAELAARKKQYEYYRDDLLLSKKSYPEVKLGDICALITKGTTPKNYTKTGIAFVKTESFNGSIIMKDKLSYIDEETHSNVLKRSILQEDDILVTIAGATIGKCAMISKDILPANTNQALAIIRLKEGNLPKYIMYLLQSNLMKQYIQKNIKGSAQPNLNLQQINDFVIPLPPIDVQKRLVHVVDNFDAICSDLNIGLPAEIEARKKQYEYYRDALLTYAVTGEIIVKTRQDKTRQDKTRQDKTRQDKTRQDKTRQDKT